MGEKKLTNEKIISDFKFNTEEYRILASATVYESDKEVADSINKICEAIERGEKPKYMFGDSVIRKEKEENI